MHSFKGVIMVSTISPKTGIPSSKWQRTTAALRYSAPSIFEQRTLCNANKKIDYSGHLDFEVVHVLPIKAQPPLLNTSEHVFRCGPCITTG